MRPTDIKHVTRVEDKESPGTFFVLDPGMSSLVLTKIETEVWLELLKEILSGFTSNSDLTSNNQPTTISDEACLMADRAFLAYRFRVKNNNNQPSAPNNNKK